MPTTALFRPGHKDDSAALAVMADTATGGLSTFMWRGLAAPGQSALDLGYTTIRSSQESPIFHENWQVAVEEGVILGALLGFPLPIWEGNLPAGPSDAVMTPLETLKAIAGGTWYLSVLSVLPEQRDQGLGTALLFRARVVAEQAGCSEMSLIVSSENEGARRLYDRFGFQETARRPLVPFPGSYEIGDWVLMKKTLGG